MERVRYLSSLSPEEQQLEWNRLSHQTFTLTQITSSRYVSPVILQHAARLEGEIHVLQAIAPISFSDLLLVRLEPLLEMESVHARLLSEYNQRFAYWVYLFLQDTRLYPVASMVVPFLSRCGFFGSFTDDLVAIEQALSMYQTVLNEFNVEL